MTTELSGVIEKAKADYQKTIDSGRVVSAKDADDRAEDVACSAAMSHGFAYPHSDEYDAILSALFVIAQDAFPCYGDEED
jgi:hypothetical protein